MAAAEVKAPAERRAKIHAVTLMRAATLNGETNAYWQGSKYVIERNNEGDLRILAPNGRILFVPKALAIVEFEE